MLNVETMQCSNCGKEFDYDLIYEYEIEKCPYCGENLYLIISLEVFTWYLTTEIYHKNKLLKNDVSIEVDGELYTIKIVEFENVCDILFICDIINNKIYNYRLINKDSSQIMSYLYKFFSEKHSDISKNVNFENINTYNIFKRYFE